MPSPKFPSGPLIGHNGGPPIDMPHRPEWGEDGVGSYFVWRAARAVQRRTGRADMMLRLRNAERLGLTYDEYSREICERGRYLHSGDEARIATIVAARRGR